jgi:cobalt/nickel transport protein
MSKNKKIIILLLLLCVVLTIIPFIVSSGAGFGGTDDAAGIAVGKITPGYEPWTKPIAEVILGGKIPAETQTLLFCLKSALGSGILCFGFGYLVARKKFTKQTNGEIYGESSKTGSKPPNSLS